ncbi:hydrolase, TatD family [Gemmatirosa kalamazoonensis]|uniref:Hydrolase, TatD family n=1 Tax=Gemmatirosa kalamazoonensis TaxID=861299 RepID=W0RIZ1_9BACT|nr:TatD family hydrolase [Gemmatirosa kalamazoonensis]AHG90731.1 hydrolase, TatD family [Gemmatirosa kalamazoonensis]
MLAFVDSHTHLADPAFDADRDDVIARARDAGALALVCIGESLAAAERARAIAVRHPGFVSFTAGVHPHDADTFDAERDLAAIRAEVAAGAVAVGECGLDYHYDHSPRDRQIAAFEAQLDLAYDLERPVVVHTREAADDTLSLVYEAGKRGVVGVLHCYTGSHDLARAALDVGWYVSFSGIVTFKRWTDDELLRLVPDDRLLAESDAPYLAPTPHRGKRNEPAWVPRTVERLAQARAATAEHVAALVIDNARRCFGLAIAGAPR